MKAKDDEDAENGPVPEEDAGGIEFAKDLFLSVPLF
jgi:hypothetical protein